MTDLQKLLRDKCSNNTIGHFYILKANALIENPVDYLDEWIQQFLISIIPNVTPSNVTEMNHPDILFIRPKENKTNFTLEDFDDFFGFIKFKAFNFPKRFIVVYDTHKISNIISNKLLVTLESPPDDTVIFFLNPFNVNLLPTIQSRALTLTITSKDLNQDTNNYFEKIEDISPDFFDKATNGLSVELKNALHEYKDRKCGETKVLELLKNSNDDQNAFFKLLIKLNQSLLTDFEQKNVFLSDIQWFQQSTTFRNSVSERFFALMRSTFR